MLSVEPRPIGRRQYATVAKFGRSAFRGLIRYMQWLHAAQVCHSVHLFM